MQFLERHPHCCFCGGTVPATTADHVPSRACFDNRNWPEGFEFPACVACNGDTANAEQIVALFSRSLANPAAPVIEKEVARLGEGVFNNAPDVVNEFFADYRPLNEQIGVFETGPETVAALELVFQKWARAFYYLETQTCLSPAGRVMPLLLTLERIQRGDIPPALFDGAERPVRRNGTDLSGQFGYVHQAQPEIGMYKFVVMFRRSFAAVLFVDTTGEHVAHMRANEGRGT